MEKLLIAGAIAAGGRFKSGGTVDTVQRYDNLNVIAASKH